LPIVEWAVKEDRIIITQDTDYGTLIVPSGRLRPSVILFRMRDGQPSTQIRLLGMYMPQVQASLEAGAIVVIGDAAIRVRMLQ
jgi:predicted nuclease of predicted toxin-antitoxin system